MLEAAKQLPCCPVGPFGVQALEFFDDKDLYTVARREIDQPGSNATCRLQAQTLDAPVQLYVVPLSTSNPSLTFDPSSALAVATAAGGSHPTILLT